MDAVVEGCSACEILRCDGTGRDPVTHFPLLKQEKNIATDMHSDIHC